MTDWAIDAALADPEGCRKALFALGGFYNWPACQLGPIRFQEGKEAWLTILMQSEGLQLGLAWDAADIDEMPEGPRAMATAPTPSKSMAKSQKESKPVAVLQPTKYEGLEPGVYPARIAEIVDQPAKPKAPGMLFEPKPQLMLQFVVLDDEGRDTVAETRGWCNASWGPKAKLYEWAQAILRSKCPPPTEPIDTDLLVGRKVDIQVEQEGDKNPRITRLYPYRTLSSRSDDDEDIIPVKAAAAEVVAPV